MPGTARSRPSCGHWKMRTRCSSAIMYQPPPVARSGSGAGRLPSPSLAFRRRAAMAEPHVIGALRSKRSELAGMVMSLERQLVQHRASLTHLDATMRLFDPELRPEEIPQRQRRTCNAWFRPGECLRLIYDVLRDAPAPVTTRELAERIVAMKSLVVTDDRQRALIQKTILASLNRAKETIERVETAGVAGWRVRQAARARCQ